MCQLKIPLLTRHPVFIPVSVTERSVYELLGDRLEHRVENNGPVQLMHPPVLLIQEGDEDVLNSESLIAQLKNGSGRPLVPSSVVTWVIETETVPAALLRFIFGPLQRMYYQTKHMNGELLWRANMRQLWDDPFLRSCVEESFFDGVTLESRHYKQLMSPLQLSSRSIDGQLALLRSQSEAPQDDLQDSEPAPAEQTMQPDESGVAAHLNSDATPHCGDTEKKPAEQQHGRRYVRFSPEYVNKIVAQLKARENSEENEQ
ncbi:hypothetical protein [Vreelandella arcis]|uniref:Uncharacterized protein n=1 Tax=Vreelandella arcis TaxID=416873 RepID=A0A1H0IA19_9GAMM|nr:hypothetical protein [Halomonas arcis]SDO28215.1 hypothetical protein SAMN04487951_11916 [Halomonas arcis]